MTNPTLIRTRGDLLVFAYQTDLTVSHPVTLGLGIGVFPHDSASGLGATAYELPFSHFESHRWLSWRHVSLIALPPDHPQQASDLSVARFEVDVKAKRKLTETDVVLFVMELSVTNPPDPSVTVGVSLGGRMLLQEV